ncbi:putative 1-aminocyclopropane-1-carboxylate synthase-like protein 2 [Rosellinia necatrix]|uniref:Putative 1-aminocyclopropane-1-carboxylate synthase-like protein 2 n=1 Tax=Rosellinia necatrix TaxID=77044 RepID=A0A1W2TCI8_ROSNE|nr:putative 1-aminocyclopropane-1-carboxylate synthase-like protein 2 [Rosellinia necatrix]
MLSRRVQKSLNWLSDAVPAAPPYPEDVVKMDSAENWLVRPYILPIMKEAISSSLTDEHLSYQKNYGGNPELLDATSAMLNRFFAPRSPVRPEHIVVGAGAAAILDSIDFAICEPDDGLLIDAPMWEGFGLAGQLRNDDRLVPVARPPSYATREQAAAHYARAVEAAPCRVRGILVCNPQNPYGHVYPRFWIEAVLQFCEARGLHYISDEIYGMSAFGPPSAPLALSEKSQPVFESPETAFASVLSFDLARLGVDPARVHCIYGISKDLGSSGLRLGFFITQRNPELRHALAVLNRFRVSNASSLMGLGLFSDLLALEAVFARNRLELRAAAEYVGDFLAFHHVSFYRPAAGCFLWARLGARGHGVAAATADSDAELWRRLASAGVALAAGAAFAEPEHGWFRITYALPREDLERGVRRIEAALDVREKWTPPDRRGSGGALVARAIGCQQRKKKSPARGFGLTLRWIMGWL